MKLTELDPRWLEKEGRHIGITFLCPCCQKDRLTCWLEAPAFRDQVPIMHAALNSSPEGEDDWPVNWVPAKAGTRWAMSNLDSFDTMTVTPSVDASASGNWHGFITKGEIR